MKTWQRRGIAVVLALGCYLACVVVVTLLFADETARRIGDVVSIVVILALGSRRQSRRRAQLVRLWALADALDYSAADVRRQAARYGTMDWELSRQANAAQFAPSPRVVARVIAKLEALQRQRR